MRRQDDTQKESELRKIMKQIKKKKVELLNKFYEQKAQNINEASEASEARKIDREFSEAKIHHMYKESHDLLVSKSALSHTSKTTILYQCHQKSPIQKIHV